MEPPPIRRGRRWASTATCVSTTKYKRLYVGARYEGYMPALMGVDVGYNQQRGTPDDGGASRIFHRFVEYKGTLLSLTAGNFYEQFGSGAVLRTYWEPDLGLDTSLDGFRARYVPDKGLRLTGLLGRMRRFFSYEPGVLSGADAELILDEWLPSLQERGMFLSLGASVVNRYTAAQIVNEQEAGLPKCLGYLLSCGSRHQGLPVVFGIRAQRKRL